jgi:hypothetical protein
MPRRRRVTLRSLYRKQTPALVRSLTSTTVTIDHRQYVLIARERADSKPARFLRSQWRCHCLICDEGFTTMLTSAAVAQMRFPRFCQAHQNRRWTGATSGKALTPSAGDVRCPRCRRFLAYGRRLETTCICGERVRSKPARPPAAKIATGRRPGTWMQRAAARRLGAGAQQPKAAAKRV